MKPNALQTAWQQRSARERRLLVLAALVLGCALLWQWGVAPALGTWRMAAQRQAALDAQTRQMLLLQAEAKRLQTPARIQRQEAMALLETSASSLLGKDARITFQGDAVRLSLSAAPASGLAQWLAQAREKAQSLPQSAQLQQVAAAKPAATAQTAPSASAPPEVTWRGEITLRLP